MKLKNCSFDGGHGIRCRSGGKRERCRHFRHFGQDYGRPTYIAQDGPKADNIRKILENVKMPAGFKIDYMRLFLTLWRWRLRAQFCSWAHVRIRSGIGPRSQWRR